MGALSYPPSVTGDPHAMGQILLPLTFASCRSLPAALSIRRLPRLNLAVAALPGAGGEGVRAKSCAKPASAISGRQPYRGGRGLDPEVIAEITHRYAGFDSPLHERYFKMLRDYLLISATVYSAAHPYC